MGGEERQEDERDETAKLLCSVLLKVLKPSRSGGT